MNERPKKIAVDATAEPYSSMRAEGLLLE